MEIRMGEKIRKNKLLVLLLLTGAVYFFLKILAPLTAPVLAAMLFVTIFGPLLQRLQTRWRLHRQVGAVLLLLLACGVLGILLWILFSWMVGSLPDWNGRLDALESGLAELVQRCCRMVGEAIGVNGTYLENTIVLRIRDGIDYFQAELLPGVLSQSLEYIRLLLTVGGFLVTFLIATVLLAKDYDEIMNRMLDREECHVFLEIICGIIRYIATFVRAQAIIMSSIGVTAAVVLGVCGIRHGVLWGLLAGVLDALPFVGTGIVLVPLGIQQLFLENYWQAAVCLLVYVVCIFIRELLEPRLIGRRVGIHPVAVLVSIYAGIRLFGVWGIVAGPLGMVIVWQSYLSLARREECEREKTGEESGKADEGREKTEERN